MTLKEQIEVMNHFLNGGEVEIEISKDNWVVDYNPTWSWSYFEYRIKQEPKKIVKLYKFAYYSEAVEGYIESSYFAKDKEDLVYRLGISEDVEVIRLDWSMIEVYKSTKERRVQQKEKE